MNELGKRRKTKISRTRTGKKPNMYFHEGTAAAIEAYQKTSDAVEKERLYMAEIFPAFDKLVENLIFIHGFQGLHDTYDDLKNDCVTFLYEAIHKFDPTRGSKPFSYFNVVAKNWLIIRSKQRAAKLRRSVSIDDRETLGKRDQEAIEGYQVLPPQDEQLEVVEFVVRIHGMLDEVQRRVSNDNERACIDAIIHIFENIDKVDLLNKRAVFLYIRNISGLSAKQLTQAVSSLKRHYRELRNDDEFGIY